jgi:hypothetical protein
VKQEKLYDIKNYSWARSGGYSEAEVGELWFKAGLGKVTKTLWEIY